MARVRCVMMQKDEELLLGAWIAYYGYILKSSVAADLNGGWTHVDEDNHIIAVWKRLRDDILANFLQRMKLATCACFGF